MKLPVYIDIDGTLTMDGNVSDADVIKEHVVTVRRMAESGTPVVLWSAAGGDYAKAFAKKHNIKVEAAIGKPDYCIDDTKTIKWNGLKVRSPSYFTVIDIMDGVFQS